MNTVDSSRARGKRRPERGALAALVLSAMLVGPQLSIAKTKANQDPQPPNILAIWGDDIGWFNLSIYNHGIMDYRTPNLDRIGKQGVMFTDAYAEQSCTAGRAAFLTGQHGLRSGMMKVGLPGVPFGLSHEDPTIAEMLKSYGYTTGQFGKNHLGDVDATLPTTHGFDEFFGNLYHLNAEGEPENPDYPGDMEITTPQGTQTFYELFGPRGVIHSRVKIDKTAGCGEDAYEYPRAGANPPDDNPSGVRQCVHDTGPLTRHRMKTIDGAFAKEAIRFMGEANEAGKPFFVWYAASRMHVWTYLKEKTGYDLGPLPEEGGEVPMIDRTCNSVYYGSDDYRDVCNASIGPVDDSGTPTDPNYYFAEGQTAQGIEADGMVEHDMYAGLLLDYLDEAGLADNTIVMYTSDNGPESFSWPDGGTTPFRSEKNTNWEGGYRVPLLVRWPAMIDPQTQGGVVSNEIIALQDWFPTLAKAAGEPGDIKALLREGHTLNGKNYRVHLDGYDFTAYFQCLSQNVDQPKNCKGPRNEFIYVNDDGVIVGIRYNDWKIVFQEQREHGFAVWRNPFTYMRVPKIFNLRRDPFEKADHESSQWDVWMFDRIFFLTPAQAAVYAFLSTFNEYPPRQAPPSFGINIDAKDVIEKCGTASPADEPFEPKGCYQLPGAEEGFGLPGGGG